MIFHWDISGWSTLLWTTIGPPEGTLEDDFPFPNMGYVIIPWRVLAALIIDRFNQPKAHRPWIVTKGPTWRIIPVSKWLIINNHG